MLTPRHCLSPGHLLAILLCLASWSVADEKPKTPKAQKSKADTKAAAPADEGMGSIGNMIPEGMKNLKVRIPSFTEGRATSLIIADAMTRTDAQHLFAEGMTIKMFGATPKEDLRVELKTAIFQIDSKVLTSNERSRVSRSDFELEGDTMTFDTGKSQGKMVGRVQMIIYDTNQFSQAKPAPATASSPAPPPTPEKGK